MAEIDFAWVDATEDVHFLYAGHLPEPIATSRLRPNGKWRCDLDLPGAKHIAIGPADEIEDMIERWAVAWFRAIWL